MPICNTPENRESRKHTSIWGATEWISQHKIHKERNKIRFKFSYQNKSIVIHSFVLNKNKARLHVGPQSFQSTLK